MSGRRSYVVGFGALGVLGLAVTVVAAAGLALLGVAKRAEIQLAHLEDYLPPDWLVEP